MIQEPIAIVGMACRFPGSRNLNAFWDLLRSDRDAITEVPVGRWDPDMYTNYAPIATGEMMIGRAGFIDGIEQFDPYFFKISPREACRIDPQQRLLLEVAWEALEHGGQASSRLAGSATGVFIGMMSNEYEDYLSSDPDEFDVYDVPGNTYSIAANRLSYQFDLCGPSITVDTACSSSLVSVHLASQSLRNEECDMALAGGVNALVSPYPSIKYYQMGMLSADGLCKTFDAGANGYVRGEGAGIVVLKRLSNALRDNDHIYACIRGSAVNQNGRGAGLTAPSGDAQQKVIRMALRSAGIRANEIDYVEAHGTGTPLGDPTEVRALEEVLRVDRNPEKRCLLGSVKTNIGHTESAAGMAGLIKVVMSLQNFQIPAHRNLGKINPRLESALETFEVPSKITPWPRGKTQRYAGINSFGFGGVNAHVVLEEAPIRQEDSVEDLERPLHVLRLSAHTDTALRELARRFSEYLENHPDVPVAQVCYSINAGRSDYEERVVTVAESTEQLRKNLKLISIGESKEQIFGNTKTLVTDPKIVFLFSGQLSNCVGTGRDLYETHPYSRDILNRCSEYLQRHWQVSLLDYLYPEDDETPGIAEAWISEPALFVLEYAIAKLWMSWGVKPVALFGFGIGEYVAACIAEVFTLEEGLRLVAKRANLMVSVTPDAEIETLIEGFEPELRGVSFRSPTIPVLSMLTGDRLSEHQLGPAYWVTHTQNSVSISGSIGLLLQNEFDIYIEIGPDSAVCSELESVVPQDHLLLPSLRPDEADWNTLSTGLARLYLNNVKVDWEGYDLGYSRYKIALPTYPFERQRCWYKDPEDYTTTLPQSIDSTLAVSEMKADYGVDGTCSQSIDDQMQLETSDVAFMCERRFESDQPLIRDHVVRGRPVLPAAVYLDMALYAGERYTGQFVRCLENIVIASTLELNSRGTQLAQVVLDTQSPGNNFIHFSIGSQDTPVHAAGELAVYGSDDDSGFLDISAVRSRCTHNIETREIYKKYEDINIEYKGGFRSITRVLRNDVEALALIERSKGSTQSEDYHLHPIVVDGALQVLGAFYLDMGIKGTFLPFAIEKVTVFSRLPSNVYCYLRAARGAHQIQPDDELCKGDLILSDSTGKILVTLDGVTIKRVANSLKNSESHTQSRIENGVMVNEVARLSPQLLHRSGWRPLPIGVPVESDSASTWLVFADESGIGMELVKMLLEKGDTCIPVFAGDGFSVEHNTYRIAKGNPADYHSLVKDLHAKGIIPTGVVHMWCCTRPVPYSSDLEELEKGLERGVYSLLYLTQSLTMQFRETLEFWVMTSYGQAVEERSNGYVYPERAVLWGLAKVIPKEYARIRCAGVDLETSGRAPDELATIIFREMHATPSNVGFESWVAYRGNERMVATLKPVNNIEYEEPLPLREDGVYLISGGQGGVGLEIAKFIASKVKARFVLLNRSPLDEKRHPDRAAGVRELRAAGAEVMVESGNVSDLESMNRLVAKIKKCWGGVNGIVHSAGVLKDGLIPNMDYTHFSEVLSPKVQGTWVLDEATHGCSPDFFVMCSSMVTLIAPMGQSTHVAACSFEDSFTLYRTAVRGLKTLCINWGLWGDTGVVSTPRYKEALEAEGVYAMSNAEGVAGFAWSLASGHSRVVCGSVRTESDGTEIEYGLPQQAFSEQDATDDSEDRSTMQGVIGEASKARTTLFDKNMAGSRSSVEGEFDRLCTAYIVKALDRMGWQPSIGERVTTQELAEDLNITDNHHQLLERFLSILAEDRLVRRVDQAWEVSREMSVSEPSIQCLRMLNEYSRHWPELLLIAHCAERLPDVMRGEVEPLEVLFPGGSTFKLEELYEESPFFSPGNRQLKKTLKAMLDQLPDDRPIKILEVGAGTAATTRCLLPIFKGRQVQYVFSDMSNLFLRNASSKFAEYPFVSYQLFDVEKNPSTQGLVESEFDFVIAAHALHATRDIRQTLQNIQQVLAPGGAILLVESVQRQRWKDIVFGITDGWWRFVDSDVRPEYPILGLDAWKHVLEEVGFTEFDGLFPDEELAKEQEIIFARLPERDEEKAHEPVNIQSEKLHIAASPAAANKDTVKRMNGSLERWVQEHLVEKISMSLRVKAERIHKDQNFSDMGVDSLIGVEIIGELRKDLGVPLAPTLLFEYPTVERLSAYLIDKYEKELLKRGGEIEGRQSSENIGSVNTDSDEVPVMKEKYPEPPLRTTEAPANENSNADQIRWASSMISNHIAHSLRVPLSRIQLDRNFSEMGIDSLVGVEIISALKKELGVPLAPTLLFEYPTLELMAQHLVQQYGGELKIPLQFNTDEDQKAVNNVDAVQAGQAEEVCLSGASIKNNTQDTIYKEPGPEIVHTSNKEKSWNLQLELTNRIKVLLASSLRVPVERIAVDRNFAEMGIDSLVGVEIVSALKKDLGIPLGPTVLFEYPSMQSLVTYLLRSFADQLSGNSGFEKCETKDNQDFLDVHKPARLETRAVNESDAEPPSPEKLLRLYEQLPNYYQLAIDNASSYEEANDLIIKLSAAHGN